MGNNREKKQIRIVDSFNCPIFIVVVVVLGIDPIVSGLYLGNDHDVIYVLFENIVLSLLEIGADGLVPHPRYATQFHRLISPAAIFFFFYFTFAYFRTSINLALFSDFLPACNYRASCASLLFRHYRLTPPMFKKRNKTQNGRACDVNWPNIYRLTGSGLLCRRPGLDTCTPPPLPFFWPTPSIRREAPRTN